MSRVEGKRLSAEAERKGDVLEVVVRLKLLPGERYTGPIDLHVKDDALDAAYCRDGGKAKTG